MKYRSDFAKISFTSLENVENNRFPINTYGKVLAWDNIMIELKAKVESYTGVEFGMCVCIYYPDGESGVGFHSDLMAFGDLDIIASLSLGSERNFAFKNKATSEKYSLFLEEGSILLMGEYCQERYEHSLPLDPTCEDPRINLTFRKVNNLL